VAAVVFPLAYPGGSIRRDSLVMIVCTLAFFALCLTDGLNRVGGAGLLLGLLVVMIPTVREAARAHYGSAGMAPLEAVLGLPRHRPVIFLYIGAGLLGLPVGARLVVDSAVEIAVAIGMSETVVGLTIIAFSTSLPEMATTVVAAYRKETEVAMGTLVGSNIFNLLAIMGVASLVAPSTIPIPPLFPYLDLPVMVVAALAIAIFAWLKRPMGRKAGLLLFAAYLAYLGALLYLVREPGLA
jgi:cation:H+ antiporter